MVVVVEEEALFLRPHFIGTSLLNAGPLLVRFHLLLLLALRSLEEDPQALAVTGDHLLGHVPPDSEVWPVCRGVPRLF